MIPEERGQQFSIYDAGQCLTRWWQQPTKPCNTQCKVRILRVLNVPPTPSCLGWGTFQYIVQYRGDDNRIMKSTIAKRFCRDATSLQVKTNKLDCIEMSTPIIFFNLFLSLAGYPQPTNVNVGHFLSRRCLYY